MWNKLLAWASDSETILWARAQMALGVLLAALAGMSWGPLVSLVTAGGFTKGQVLGLFVVLAAQGLVTEIVRRYRATDL